MKIMDKRYLSSLIVLGGILAGLACTTRISPCLSESLEGVRGILALKSSRIIRGDIVFIKNHRTDLYQSRNYAKRVVGVPGDRIEVLKNQMRVSGQEPLAVFERSSAGKDLHPLTVQEIPEGYFFVVGDHDRSFDSRYQEFGLVPLKAVWGKAVLTW